MGFDLKSSVSSKKNVDFNDNRYSLSDKFKNNGMQTVRPAFTLYDNKGRNTNVEEISAAYELSDKRMPMGELLNKMVDLIVDMEDGTLDSQNNAIYAWKYSVVLLEMYDDKVRRQEKLELFDNSLKSSVINSNVFTSRYPGRYTNRTNFFSSSVKSQFCKDVVETFKETAVPGIQAAALDQSRKCAELHENKTLDKIVEWAVDNYNCKADAFYDVKENPLTHLYYSVNTVIIHLPNGYDISIVGTSGTDHDSKFTTSVFDTSTIDIKEHQSQISQNELKRVLSNASKNEAVSPIAGLVAIEQKKAEILQQQYNILINIKPMVHQDKLNLLAAERVVGHDYIWGCQKFRETHDDLPDDFKLEDVKLPELDEEAIAAEQRAAFLGQAMQGMEEVADNGNVKNLFDVDQSNIREDSGTGFNTKKRQEKPQEASHAQSDLEDDEIVSMLLPGAGLNGPKKSSGQTAPKVTGEAQKAPTFNKIWKDQPAQQTPVQAPVQPQPQEAEFTQQIPVAPVAPAAQPAPAAPVEPKKEDKNDPDDQGGLSLDSLFA